MIALQRITFLRLANYCFACTLLLLGSSLDAQEDVPPQFSLKLEEALVSTLKNQKDIQISYMNILSRAGVLQESAGPFDPLLTESVTDLLGNTITESPFTTLSPLNRSHFHVQDMLVQGSIQKQTRAGTAFTLNGIYENFWSNRLKSTRASQVFFQIDQPLLRNFLNGIDRQTEIANAMLLKAARWDSLQEISTRINNTISAFWEVVAAQQNVKIYREAIARLEKLGGFAEKLIQGEQIAAEDLNQILAEIDNQRLLLFQSEDNLYSSKQNLIFAMGYFDDEADKQFEKKFIIEETLPPLDYNEQSILRKKDHFVDLAFTNRYDVLASLYRIANTEALVIGAENAALPQFDVIGSVAVNDLNPYFQALTPQNILTSQVTGLKKNWSTNYTIGVAISVPLFNDAALGQLTQQVARNVQNNLQLQLLKQELITQILQAIYRQAMLHQQWNQSDQAAKTYLRLVNDEQERLKAGFGSVFVLLSFETSYINALNIQVGLAKQYIQGIAQLRYLTGTLIISDESICKVDFTNILEYPE